MVYLIKEVKEREWDDNKGIKTTVTYNVCKPNKPLSLQQSLLDFYSSIGFIGTFFIVLICLALLKNIFLFIILLLVFFLASFPLFISVHEFRKEINKCGHVLKTLKSKKLANDYIKYLKWCNND